jgi:hypothetical protein
VRKAAISRLEFRTGLIARIIAAMAAAYHTTSIGHSAVFARAHIEKNCCTGSIVGFM